MADFGHQCVLLQHLAGNVKRQVGRVDDSLDKAQIRRHQLFYLVGNEHPVDVKFQPLFSVRLEQIVRLGGRNVQKPRVLNAAFRLKMQCQPRIVEIVRNMPVKILVLFFGNFRLVAGP